MAQVTIVIPAYNEAGAVADTVQRVKSTFARFEESFEILVVDDGSTDGTAKEARRAGADVIRHPTNTGYGNALLTGIRAAKYPVIAITDADGTYPVQELPSMVNELEDRQLDMLVGARSGTFFHGPPLKRLARWGLKSMAEFACGRSIPDINSGLRVMRRDMALRFANLLCGGFSFTTTITIIAFLTHHFVAYRKIDYSKRVGTSHVRYARDILRTQQLLAMTIINFNPIKFFMLFSIGLGLLAIPATAGSILFPAAAIPILIASLFFAAACVLMGIGFHSVRESNTSSYRSNFSKTSSILQGKKNQNALETSPPIRPFLDQRSAV